MKKNINRLRWKMIKPLHKKGLSTTKISKETGLHPQTIARILEKKGLKSNGQLKGKNLKRDYDIEVTDEIRMRPRVRNVLVIGDLHEPFCLPDYLKFCKKQYEKYSCNHVIFIGDVIDNHFSSYHETDADGMGGGVELELAIKRIAKWVKAFPSADVCIGNHDRLIMRKAFSGGIPRAWIREYKDVLNAPGWDFQEQFIYDGVKYIHGEGGTARARMKKDLHSVVQGHLHTQGYTEYVVGQNYKIFGSQVGCGIDDTAYAMAYAKNFGKSVIGCAVVLDGGKQPINILATLEGGRIINN